jgi:cyclopropane fatty-acyl-phospholipid synthase-like methyltransferase
LDPPLMNTDWELRYQTGDMRWEKGAPSPGLVDFLATHKLAGRVLVPGCGWGHDVRAISCGENEVVGIDIAPSAISGAEKFPRVANERYQLADLFDLPPGFHGAFDWVWEHTCFCAIDPTRRADYAASVAAALNPDGHFLAVFYMNPDNDSLDKPPYGTTTRELDGLFGASFVLIEEWIPARTYEGRAGREVMRLLRRR